MLTLFWKARQPEGGFTLIELVVVLAILGILVALAVPRYLGTRRNAMVAEGDNVLHELKTLAWAYYIRHNSWVGLTPVNVLAALGFAAPGSGCWAYGVAAVGTDEQIQLRAVRAPVVPTRCNPLPTTSEILLTLNSDGSSARSTSGLW